MIVGECGVWANTNIHVHGRAEEQRPGRNGQGLGDRRRTDGWLPEGLDMGLGVGDRKTARERTLGGMVDGRG